MPHVPPLTLDESAEASEQIAWLASATGFVANSMLTLSRRPEIAKAVLGLIKAVVRNPEGTVPQDLRWMVAHVTSWPPSSGCPNSSGHSSEHPV